VLIVRNHLGLETTRVLEFQYPLHREVAFFRLMDKVHCEMWETGADRPFSLCFEGKKKRFRTHWNMAWANCQVVDYGVDVTDEGGLGKGWRWLERPHGNRTVHSLEVWADLFSWIDLVTWVVVEGRGYCFRDSIDILDPMD